MYEDSSPNNVLSSLVHRLCGNVVPVVEAAKSTIISVCKQKETNTACLKSSSSQNAD